MESEVSGERSTGGKGREAFRTISEVAEQLDLPQHVLRFWESKFSQIKPLKRGGNRRYYRPDDVALITAIKTLLHTEGYTIRGVQKLFKAQGVKATISLALGELSSGDELAESAQHFGAADVGLGVDNNDFSANISQVVDAGKVRDILSRLKVIRAQLD
tara:strand:- start:3018 stop:3494 length:477 start_codon:yes stop_codon:yes gene_type:complete